MKRSGGVGGVFYFGKKGGWKVIEKEADVNIQERCNNVHFDDRVKSSGRPDELLVFLCGVNLGSPSLSLRGKIRGKLDYVSQLRGMVFWTFCEKDWVLFVILITLNCVPQKL